MSHWQSKAKIRPSDKVFSEYIRKRDRKCQFGIKCNPIEHKDWDTGELDIRGLDCVHWQGRGSEGTRYDPDNCYAGCKKCHNYLHTYEGTRIHDNWMLERVGQRRYQLLQVQANTYCKRDEKMSLLYAKEMLKSLQN